MANDNAVCRLRKALIRIVLQEVWSKAMLSSVDNWEFLEELFSNFLVSGTFPFLRCIEKPKVLLLMWIHILTFTALESKMEGKLKFNNLK